MKTDNKKSRTLRIVTVIVATTWMLLSGNAMAQEVFAELATMDNVESTYVSGRFAHNKKYWTNNSRTLYMNLSRGFSSLYSYQCYSEEAVDKAREILRQYLKKNPDMEVMMKTTQGTQEYTVYEKFIDEGKKVVQMIIWNSDAPNVCEIAVINWKNGLEHGSSQRYDSNLNRSLADLKILNSLDLDVTPLSDRLCVAAKDLESTFSSLDRNLPGIIMHNGSFNGIP